MQAAYAHQPHAEVCAQALYRGQALVAKSDETREALLAAAQEEKDHLDWCEERWMHWARIPADLILFSSQVLMLWVRLPALLVTKSALALFTQRKKA